MKMVCLAAAALFSYCAIEMILEFLLKKQLQINERLSDLSQVKKETLVSSEEKKDRQLLRFIHISKKLKEEVSLSGIRLRPEEFIMIWFLLIFAPAMLLFAFAPDLIQCIGLFLIGLVVPPFFLKMAAAKQRSLFEAQLGDALMVLSNGLRAGFSFEQALENVSGDLANPIGGELNTIVRELKLGGELEQSFLIVADRMESDDLKLLTTAVVIQQRVGGNLAEILDIISQTIRDRLTIKRSIKTLTAQGRITGQVIGVLPILLLLALSFANPGYISPLFSSLPGRLLLLLGGSMEIFGFLIINKIVNIKF
ncbi:type II secretion system F family protein [Lacrimispora amygdalina]|nr:type II secretion system F family protein [Clostridium indicum]